MKRRILSFLVLALYFPGTALAIGPEDGEITESGSTFVIGDCNVSSITVKWRLDSIFGEPTVNGSFKWSGNESCSLPYSTMILLNFSNGGSSQLKIDPVIPKANAGYGFNTTGSPNWNSMLCTYDGTSKMGCLEPDAAKNVWRNGSVTGFSVAW